MSIYADFSLKDRQAFGGILELEEGEQQPACPSEPKELPVCDLKKGVVFLGQTTTGDDNTTGTDRPLKVWGIKAEINGIPKRIMSVIDVLDGKKGTVTMKITDGVTVIPRAMVQIRHDISSIRRSMVPSSFHVLLTIGPCSMAGAVQNRLIACPTCFCADI